MDPQECQSGASHLLLSGRLVARSSEEGPLDFLAKSMAILMSSIHLSISNKELQEKMNTESTQIEPTTLYNLPRNQLFEFKTAVLFLALASQYLKPMFLLLCVTVWLCTVTTPTAFFHSAGMVP